MNNKQLWEFCVEAAALLVESYKGPVEAVGFDVGGGDSSGSTAFSRRGTSTTQKEFTLPSDLSALLSQSYLGGQLSPTTTGNEAALLNLLLSQSGTSLPGLGVLQSVENLSPTSFSGTNALNGMIARNPYSLDYESAIGAMYDRMFTKGRALAQSGPANVRGGTARQGFELAELDAEVGRHKFQDVRQQQDKEAGVVQQAVQMMNLIEQSRRGSQLQAQGQHMTGEHSRKAESLAAAGDVNEIRKSNQGNIALASDLLGRPKQTTTDNLTGRGNQATQQSNWGVGLTCCFIFLEALNGELPEYVRRGRDDFNTANRRKGYLLLSQWLVPLMKSNPFVRWLVNFLLVKPFLKTGGWWYADKTPVLGRLFYPYCWAWFFAWSFLGWSYGKLFRHHSVSSV